MERRIRTVLYYDQFFFRTEIELLHVPIIQRLYDLRQLGFADKIFVDASHTRFSHVLGVMEQATNISAAIQRNLTQGREQTHSFNLGDESYTPAELVENLQQKQKALRLIALFHDITHGPYGHTLEDEIELFKEKHDHPERQAEAFWVFLNQFIAWAIYNYFGSLTRENLPEEIIQLPNSGKSLAILGKALKGDAIISTLKKLELSESDYIECVCNIFKIFLEHLKKLKDISSKSLLPGEYFELIPDLHFAFNALLHLEIIHKAKIIDAIVPTAMNYPFNQLLVKIIESNSEIILSEIDEFNPHRDSFYLDIIGNTICADLLDYAKRDSTSAGLKLDYDSNRIIDNFTLTVKETTFAVNCEDPVKRKYAESIKGRSLRTAVSVFNKKLRLDVIGELMNLLQVRYFVYERMLFHPTKCIAGALLGKAIQCLGMTEIPEDLKFKGDSVFLENLVQAAESILNSTGQVKDLSPLAKILMDNYSTLPEETKYLEILKNFIQSNATKDYFSDLCRELNEGEEDFFADEFVFTENNKPIFTEIVTKKLKEHKRWLRPSVEDYKIRLNIGLELLGRIRARQYPRRVFIMLPIEMETTTAIRKTTPELVAEKFLNPRIRLAAEVEIERRCGLPEGSCIIHCPPASGPKKIANVLITDYGDSASEAVPLKMINDLDCEYKSIFSNHAKMINALESQYSSIWRLTVSITPPMDLNYKNHQKHIASVISEILTDGANKMALPEKGSFLKEVAASIVSVNLDDTLPSNRVVELKEALFNAARLLPEVQGFLSGQLAANSDDLNYNSADKLAKRIVVAPEHFIFPNE